MSRWKRVALLGALCIGVPWLCTGGLVVHEYWVLPVNSFNEERKPYIRVEVTRPSANYGVPFIYLYHTDRTPFGIKLTYITHNVVEEPRITFDRVTVEHPDGSNSD